MQAKVFHEMDYRQISLYIIYTIQANIPGCIVYKKSRVAQLFRLSACQITLLMRQNREM